MIVSDIGVDIIVLEQKGFALHAVAVGGDSVDPAHPKQRFSGPLWEERFNSVIVESGSAARTIAAYIDLNPVRTGIVSDPAE